MTTNATMSHGGVVLGIDLGTTQSAVGVCIQPPTIHLLPDRIGRKIIPSVVQSVDGSWRLAQQEQVTHCVWETKRLIGRTATESIVTQEAERQKNHFTITPNEEGRICYQLTDGTETDPISAARDVLAGLVDECRANLPSGVQIDGAVITVPAHFNDAQRQATKQAAAAAGLNVLRLLNEPTAAALAYGLADETKADTILVFDWGGGTLDISILELNQDMYEVLAVAGDTYLGGADVDKRIADHLLSMPGTAVVPGDAQRIAKQLKEQLSDAERVPVPNTSDHLDRITLNRLCADLFERCMEEVRKGLRMAGLQSNDIDAVVLVGGSTRMPAIRQALCDVFGGSKMKTEIAPEEIVACGASLYAYALQTNDREALATPILLDVTPLPIGIRTASGKTCVILPANTAVPINETVRMCLGTESQTTCTVEICQGEHDDFCDNLLLGSFQLQGLLGTQSMVEINVRVDMNGLIHVSAKDLATVASNSITI